MIKHLAAIFVVCLGIVNSASAQNSYYFCSVLVSHDQGVGTIYYSSVFAKSDTRKSTLEDAFRSYVLATYHENNLNPAGCYGRPTQQDAQNQKNDDMNTSALHRTVVDTGWSYGQR